MKINFRDMKTLTINECDPDRCRFEQCPMHTGSANPFPVKPEPEQSGPGVVAITCRQNPLLAKALIEFANRLKGAKKNGRLV
jgi:hypothetical protein